MEHDLTADELAFMAERINNKTKRWYWIGVGEQRMERPEVHMEDGRIVMATANGEWSTKAIVRAAYDAIRRRYERRSAAARKAAVTRAKRKEKAVYEAARLLEAKQLEPRQHCRICGRILSDPESIRRGIGSECWQRVLGALQ